MESLWTTLKTETFGTTIPMIFDYITTLYNSKRLHSSLGYMPSWTSKHPSTNDPTVRFIEARSRKAVPGK
jgi:transposase InsO family protein